MENRRKRWRTSKGVAKVNGSVGGYFSFPLDFSLETLRFESRESNSSKRVEISKRFVKKLEREEKCQVVKQRLSLKSISREHRENRPNFLLHVAICNDARLNYNLEPNGYTKNRDIAIENDG